MFEPLRFFGAALAVLCLVGIPFGYGAAAEPAVVGVRSGEQANATRFVLDLSADVPFTLFLLDNPYRVVVDFPPLEWRVGDVQPVRRGLIQGYRFGLFNRSTSRLVLDVSGPVQVARSFLLPPSGRFPYRFVIDLEQTTREAFDDSGPGPAATASGEVGPLPRIKPSDPTRLDERLKTIVLDPGHGGIDPGTIGRRGTREKEITLAVAEETRRVLEETGRYRVLMTREEDVFVRLRDRVAFAHQSDADLFISLHADSLEDRNVRGASVYTLSETASDREAEALAQRENKADLIAGIDLENQPEDVATILIDLTRRETMNLSATFASLVLPEFKDTGKTLRKGHRFAGFAVLKAPDVPSVLIELGYLSNPLDERQLTSPAFQQALGKSILRAVDSYFSELSQ